MRAVCRSLILAAVLSATVLADPAAAETPDVVYLSNEQYEAARSGRWPTDLPMPTDCRGAIAGDWSAIKWEEKDLRGIDIPIRKGDSALGYSHYSGKHNLCTREPVAAAFRTRKPDKDLGARQEYVTYVVERPSNKLHLTIRVIVQAASSTDDRRYRTEDRRNVGLITAYCENVPQNRCPQWVDEAR